MSIDIKPNHKAIKEYYKELASFEKHGHSNEMTVRNAFQDLTEFFITINMNTNEIVNGLPKDGFGE